MKAAVRNALAHKRRIETGDGTAEWKREEGVVKWEWKCVRLKVSGELVF